VFLGKTGKDSASVQSGVNLMQCRGWGLRREDNPAMN